MAKGRILHVEDDPNWQAIVKELLGEEYELHSAIDLKDAAFKILAMCANYTPFDLAIFDINFDCEDVSDKQGLFFADTLRKTGHGLKVIALSAFVDQNWRIAFRDFKVIDVFDKACFDIEEFVQVVTHTIEETKQERSAKSTLVNDLGHKVSRGRDVISILFLASEPTELSRLRLGEELRAIQERLQVAKLRDHFELYQWMSVRPVDLSQALLDIQPRIIHFSGHGIASGALCFENQQGEIHLIEPDALAALSEQFADQVKCIVLNACYSEIQARAIAKHIDFVIGMSQAICDKAGIAFSIGFYQALGAGKSIEDAYLLGCIQIKLQGVPEHLMPILLKRDSCSL